MYNLPDEEFDRLCREAAEHPEAQVPMHGWDRMRQRLDREMPDDKGRRRAWPFWIPFLLFVPISLFVWKNQAGEQLQASVLPAWQQQARQEALVADAGSGGQTPAPQDADPQRNASIPFDAASGTKESSGDAPTASGKNSTEATAAPAPNSHSPASDAPNLSASASTAPVAKAPVSSAPASTGTAVPNAKPVLAGKPKASTKAPAPRNSGPAAGSATTFDRVHQQAFAPQGSRLISTPTDAKAPVTSSADKGKDTDPAKDGSTPNTSLPMRQTAADGTAGQGAVPPASTDRASAQHSLSDGSNGGKTPIPPAAAPGAAASPTVAKKSKAPAKPVSPAERGFGFSLVAGPDWSNVRFSAPDKMGLNAGITIQYRFNKRLVLQTGLMYSQKHYTVTDAQYPGYNTSNPNFKMLRVQANCFMWDIPLNLRFDAWSTPKRKAYVLAGVSSYLMSREDLHYYFTWNNTPRYKGWVNETDKMYNLSEFNFAIGYEHALSREWSVKLEPFIKLPISSVGTGEVNLTSLGALAGITYTPLRLFKPTPKK